MSNRQSTHDAEQDDRNDQIKIYVNGNIVPRPEAVVSVYDSGFMLGDGVWEGLRLYHGKLSFLDEHIRRLYDAAKTLDMDIGLSKAELIQAVQDTLAANDMHHDVHVRLMVTRGVKRKPFQDPRLSQDGPTIVIIAEHSKVSEQFEDQLLRLHTVPFYRGLPMTQDAKLNTHSKLNCIIALNHALKVGADEALMLDPYGFVNTTNSTNFFIVRDGEVWTSSGDYCMAGITRKKVIHLCRDNGIPVYEKNYSLTDVYTADEAFVTGTFGAQTWVKEIDGHTIGEGKAGPMFQALRKLYKVLVGAYQ
ncbi:MAG: branched-chain amino acid aminotransferase [Saprospiraceae bacterium]|jgi:branched-chain amino acid aminotransferase